MGSMQFVVAKPQSFVTLDNFLNSTANHVPIIGKLTASTTDNIGFGSGGLYPTRGPLFDHWKNDWIGKLHEFGGAYWPYLFEIDVATILRDGFVDTIGRLGGGKKNHNTIWICAGKPPDAWLNIAEADYEREAKRDPTMDKAQQEPWFEVVIQEGADVVNLMICTPMPLDEFKARQGAPTGPGALLARSSANSRDDPETVVFRPPPVSA